MHLFCSCWYNCCFISKRNSKIRSKRLGVFEFKSDTSFFILLSPFVADPFANILTFWEVNC